MEVTEQVTGLDPALPLGIFSGGRTQKRKSLGDGSENVNPNAMPPPEVQGDNKKARSLSAPLIIKADAPVATTAAKASGIARYKNPVRAESSKPAVEIAKKSIAPSICNPVGAKISTLDTLQSRAQGPHAAESNVAQNTATPEGSTLRRKKTTTATPGPEKLTKIFDETITVSNDTISTILAQVKDKDAKAKYDYKEKCKKLDVALKELRDTAIRLVAETKQVRSKCVWYESDSESRLQQTSLQLQEVAQMNNMLKANEQKMKKELVIASEKVIASELVCKQLRGDTEKVKDLESRIGELVAKLADEQSRSKTSEAVLARMEKDLSEAKQNAAEDLKLAKGQYEQHAEQLVGGYKSEVASLRADLDRRALDLERCNSEKAELERKSSDLREEIVKMQANLRETEGSAQRQEVEAGRIAKELEQTKEQLTQKDADWRSTLTSLNEMQRQVADERGSSRAEISSLQSRVSLLEEERLSLTKDLAVKSEEAGVASREASRLAESLAAAEAKIVAKDAELSIFKEVSIQLEIERELRAKSEIREDAERRERIAASAQLQATQTDCNSRLEEQKQSLTCKIESLRLEVIQITQQRDESAEEVRRQADIVMGVENEVAQLRHALENASANHESVEKLGRVTGELEILRRRMRETAETKEVEAAATFGRIKDLEEQVKSGEIQRRKLHNVIQELRGNVRVFARVRPFLPSDGFDSAALPDASIVTRSDGQSLKIAKAAKTSEERSEEHGFSFDRVFGPSSSQEVVFQEVSEFVQSALDGYNVCLFSYGQTGSGKTHTMQGSGNGSMRGIIPRAMQQVGLYKTELEGRGWEYHMEVSFVEIYNETIKDLLRANAKDDDKHEIKRDMAGNTTITDVTMTPVDPNNSVQMDLIMEQAARYRSVGQTLMNERSSRSHSVFTLHLRATNAAQGVVLKGALNLVDLAGSERLDRSGATGDRLKETVAINKSLSALTDVFVAIGNKQSHIPFRNSKLTYLLQPALSGDGKTLMLVNLSPTEESYFESVCSLRFASQVNQCELGKPKRQMKDAPKDDQVTPAAKTQPFSAKSGPTSSSASGPAKKMARK